MLLTKMVPGQLIISLNIGQYLFKSSVQHYTSRTQLCDISVMSFIDYQLHTILILPYPVWLTGGWYYDKWILNTAALQSEEQSAVCSLQRCTAGQLARASRSEVTGWCWLLPFQPGLYFSHHDNTVLSSHLPTPVSTTSTCRTLRSPKYNIIKAHYHIINNY